MALPGPGVGGPQGHRLCAILGPARRRRVRLGDELLRRRAPVPALTLARGREPELGRANLTGLVLGCIEAKFCKKICV